MGGSAIGGDIVKQLASSVSSIPVIVHRDYGLPLSVGKDSLVIAVSYSGNTEETLDAYEEARRRRASLWTISSGGKLEEAAHRDRIAHVKIPSGQPPRCSLGYLLLPVLKMCSCINLIEPVDFEGLRRTVSLVLKQCAVAEEANNPAKNLAGELRNKNVVIYSGQFLSPAALRWKQQLAENSKHIASANIFPELNHNEIMAWSHPEFLAANTVMIFLYDETDHARVKRRMDLTAEILGVKSIPIFKLFGNGSRNIERLMYLILLGDWVSFFLAIYNRTDPTEIKEISDLKERLTAAS
jgi:glucose/mannose-6-phosphate isomerase